jgi:hypothetical protein
MWVNKTGFRGVLVPQQSMHKIPIFLRGPRLRPQSRIHDSFLNSLQEQQLPVRATESPVSNDAPTTSPFAIIMTIQELQPLWTSSSGCTTFTGLGNRRSNRRDSDAAVFKSAENSQRIQHV